MKQSSQSVTDRSAAEIRQFGIRRWEFQRFIASMERLSETVAEFDEAGVT